MRGPIICDLCFQLLIVKADGHANEVLGRTRPFDECASDTILQANYKQCSFSILFIVVTLSYCPLWEEISTLMVRHF